MNITFDPEKRNATLEQRGLDFLDAAEVLARRTIRWIDDRFDYAEERWIAVGKLENRMVVVVYTERDEGWHIISMRKANDREQRKYEIDLD